MKRLSALSCFLALVSSGGAAWGFVAAPILKWDNGGCFSSWCEKGWYSSPAVADLDGDGRMEIVGSAYSLVVVDGETGELKWRVASGHDRSEPGAGNVGRTWPGVVVTDVNHDGRPNIVTAHNHGYVSVYDHNGYFLPGWPRHPTDRELRGLVVHDLDGDGTREIIVSGAVSSRTNTWIYDHRGNLRPGWPQLSNDSGFAFGVFNDNVAVGDLDGDREVELVIPSDVHYICAYNPNGEGVPTHAMYGGKKWGAVGIWESMVPELRGWGSCSGERIESYRTNFANGAAVITDVDGDGGNEVVVTGNVYDCHSGYPPSRYTGVYIFHPDRSRFTSERWNWQNPPVDTGAPISEDYSVIENCQPNPAVADLDADGEKEIIFPAYDGKVHAFWLDKQEHHNWPYPVYNSQEGFYRFASEPVVADLDHDGCAEVIFTSWVQNSDAEPVRLGKLHLLDCRGTVLHEVSLPPPLSSRRKWNGALAAPTIADIDGDGEMELAVQTVYAGLAVYDLPGTRDAVILWRSGRNRSYSVPSGNGPAPGSTTGKKSMSPLFLLLRKAPSR